MLDLLDGAWGYGTRVGHKGFVLNRRTLSGRPVLWLLLLLLILVLEVYIVSLAMIQSTHYDGLQVALYGSPGRWT